MTKEEIRDFIRESVDWLISEDIGCCTLPLDDRLAICVGWLPGYGEEERDDCIQSKDEPDFAITAGIKVYTSDDMRTDYEFINMPYRDNGDVLQTDVAIEPNEDYDELAEYFLKEYESMKDLNMEEDGRIIEDNFEDSYEKVEEESLEEEKIEEAKSPDDLKKELERRPREQESCDKKSLKETWDGESIIEDLVDRAKGIMDEGSDLEDAITQAIDEGLIYTKDIHALLEHYGSIDDVDIVNSYYDELYNDIYSKVEDYIADDEEDDFDEFEDEEESQEESLHESVEGLSLERPKFINWKEYYLNQVCDGDEDEYNELYADSLEDTGDEVCQAVYDLDLNGKKIGEIGMYLFDGMGMWYEIGLTNLDDEVESILDDESLEIQETDLGGYGWYPKDEKDENGYMKIYSTDEEFRKALQPYVDRLAKLLV